MIPGSPEALEAAAGDLRGVGTALERERGDLRTRARTLDGAWDGGASSTAIATVERLGSALGNGSDAVTDVGPVLSTYASALRSAQRLYETGKRLLDAGDLSGLAMMGAAMIQEFVANGAAAAQVQALTGRLAAMQTAAPGTGTDGRRGPDERGGRRIRDDQRRGRAEGGDGSGGNLDSDWAGRAILERYLRGGDDWTIRNDADWNRYMMANPRLRAMLLDRTQSTAQDALARFRDGRGASNRFDVRESAEMENGEGMVGYQYLHGTDRNAGGFQRSGTTTVTPRPDGNYDVRVDSDYTWNDKIDPNPQYSTDRWKSRVAEVLTLGRADPYDIHIGWSAGSTVTLDPQGNVVGVRGYPGK